MNTELRPAIKDRTYSELEGQLTMTLAELRIVREERDLLRTVLEQVHSMALAEALNGSRPWHLALSRIDGVLRVLE